MTLADLEKKLTAIRKEARLLTQDQDVRGSVDRLLQDCRDFHNEGKTDTAAKLAAVLETGVPGYLKARRK